MATVCCIGELLANLFRRAFSRVRQLKAFRGQPSLFVPQPNLANGAAGSRRFSSTALCHGKRTVRRKHMLWTVTIILVILWAIGFIGFHVVAWWIHLLLVLALVFLIFSLLGGRRV
jgi:hypothetical protein